MARVVYEAGPTGREGTGKNTNLFYCFTIKHLLLLIFPFTQIIIWVKGYNLKKVWG